MRSFAVPVLAPSLGQHEFLLRFQHREPTDLVQIPIQFVFSRYDWQSRSSGHDTALQICIQQGELLEKQHACTDLNQQPQFALDRAQSCGLNPLRVAALERFGLSGINACKTKFPYRCRARTWKPPSEAVTQSGEHAEPGP